MEIQSDILTSGAHRLHRFSVIPDKPIARMVILHGYGDHSGKYLHFLNWLAEHGVAAQITDFRGHGRSTGRVAHVDRWEEYLEDLDAMLGGGRAKIEDRGSRIENRGSNDGDSPAILYLRSSILDSNTYILAHSHGALVAIIAALRGRLAGCAGVILTSPYLELKLRIGLPKRVVAQIASTVWPTLRLRSGLVPSILTHDPEFIEAAKTDPYCPGIGTPRWFTTATKMQTEARASAGQFKLPLLMLVAGGDVIADPRAALAFYEQAGSADKQLKEYPDLHHELLREVGREAIFQTIYDWIAERSKPI